MPGHLDGRHDGFGQQLRSRRERAGLTQEELAARAGLTPHAISALERGTRTHPYPHTVRSLADALDLSEAERRALINSVPRRRQAGSPPTPADASATSSAERSRARPGVVVPATPLYGRDGDVAEVVRLARSGSARLITLTGPGGVGKTRLAMAVADEVSRDYSDGVTSIALASLADATQVLATIGRALNTAGSDGPDALELVTEQLGRSRLLLVLDNFEHLLSAAPEVGHLVSSCPNLTVVVTSRSLLRVRGEREFVVSPLTLPTPDVTSAEALAESASGAFVLHRALEVSPSPTFDEDDARALAELCHRMAGLPLAIELATAHLRLLTPPSLLQRLDHLSALGARDLPPRQQTMRATLDWSYRLLSPDQQTLFRLLGVFRGGATLAAVERVAGALGLPTDEVVGLLELLAEHSLVVARPAGPEDLRYHLLEPVAQYARSLLLGDEALRAVRAHAQVFLDLAERAATGYEGADQVLWLNHIQADEANVLVAIDRSLDGGDPETAGRITWAMWLYWWLRSQPSVGRQRANGCLTAQLSPPVLARVHLAAATMSYAGGDVPASAHHWEEAFRLGTEQQDPEIACAGRAGTGLAALGLGELDRADRCFREALPLGEQAGEKGVWLRSLIHVWLGTIRLLRSDPRGAAPEIERGLELARMRRDRLATYVALYNLAQAAISLGDHAAARAHLSEGITLSQQTLDAANLAYFLEALAVVESAEQAPDRVAVLSGAAQALRGTMEGRIYGYYLPDESLRERAEEQARTVLGDDAYDDAVDVGRGLDLEGSVVFALNP